MRRLTRTATLAAVMLTLFAAVAAAAPRGAASAVSSALDCKLLKAALGGTLLGSEVPTSAGIRPAANMTTASPYRTST
jgi:predicted secreted protein